MKDWRIVLIILMSVICIGMKAQDKIALASPVKIETSIYKTNILDMYDDFNNTVTHAKGIIPSSFNIDLRDFCMPTYSKVITSKFGMRWKRQHKGVDIKVYIGDTIRAAWNGQVRVVKYNANGYGNFVVIRHKNGLETYYGHLSKQLVKANQLVKAGDPIGLGGNTGRSTGSHLHFETRLCGYAIDPLLLFDFVAQDITDDFYTFVKK